MKRHLCLVCDALAGITILHFGAFAETAKPSSIATPPSAISAPLKPNGQSSKKTAKDCDDEWRADQEEMMKHDMTEDSYVEQCSVEDDVTSYSLGNEDKRRPTSPPWPPEQSALLPDPPCPIFGKASEIRSKGINSVRAPIPDGYL